MQYQIWMVFSPNNSLRYFCKNMHQTMGENVVKHVPWSQKQVLLDFSQKSVKISKNIQQFQVYDIIPWVQNTSKWGVYIKIRCCFLHISVGEFLTWNSLNLGRFLWCLCCDSPGSQWRFFGPQVLGGNTMQRKNGPLKPSIERLFHWNSEGLLETVQGFFHWKIGSPQKRRVL